MTAGEHPFGVISWGTVAATRPTERVVNLALALLEICKALPERDDVKFLARLAIPLQKLCGSEILEL